MSDQIQKARRRQKLRYLVRSKGLLVGLVAVAFVVLLAFVGVRKAFPQGVAIEHLQSQHGANQNQAQAEDIADDEDDRKAVPADAAAVKEFVVDIDGAVENPGVVKLTQGKQPLRLEDAILAAGGLTAQADTARINRAAPIADGAKIHVPVKGEVLSSAADPAAGGERQPTGTDSSEAGQENGEGKININTASETQLQELPGIGPSLAHSIVEHRKKKPFRTIKDLKKVSGIGAKKYDKLKDGICV